MLASLYYLLLITKATNTELSVLYLFNFRIRTIIIVIIIILITRVVSNVRSNRNYYIKCKICFKYIWRSGFKLCHNLSNTISTSNVHILSKLSSPSAMTRKEQWNLLYQTWCCVNYLLPVLISIFLEMIQSQNAVALKLPTCLRHHLTHHVISPATSGQQIPAFSSSRLTHTPVERANRLRAVGIPQASINIQGLSIFTRQ